jgi:hypothetical protein
MQHNIKAPKPKFLPLSKLCTGDRFIALGALWTYLDLTDDSGRWCIARKHSAASIELGERGYGYTGNAICSFKLTSRVEFVPPTKP